MTLINHLKWGVLAGLVAFPVWAGDYDDVLKAVKQAWPDRTLGAAICSVDFNQLALLDLTDGAKNLGINLIIMNVKKPKELRTTLNMLLGKKPGFLVLIDEDPILGVQSGNTHIIIGQAASRNVPTVAITEDAIKLGAVFAVGPATKGKLITNPKEATRMGLSLPTEVPGIEVEAPK